MRDILEDAEGAAERGDIGAGKANRERDLQKFPKKFYKEATAVKEENGYSIALDGRPVKNTGKTGFEASWKRLLLKSLQMNGMQLKK